MRDLSYKAKIVTTTKKTEDMKALEILKKTRFYLKKPNRKIHLILNRMGNRKSCYVCRQTFNHFTKFRGGFKNIPLWMSKLNIVGSDIDNFGCIYCGAHDRERHLFMFFDKLDMWSIMKNAEVIHFAPEINLSKKIEQCLPSNYIKADLYPSNNSITKIDLTDIPFKEESFDILICNHVLEHVPDYMKALTEIYRVLKKNGIAILQTPYSKLLKKNFEDEGINTDELRLLFYGQEDHVRYFSENQFFQSLTKTGFSLQILNHNDLFESNLARYYGVNEKENLIRVIKSSS